MNLKETRTGKETTALLWIAAVAVAALGTWICYDAVPGINWVLWTLAAGVGLVWFTADENGAHRPVALMAGAAAVLAGGAAISAQEFLQVVILLSVILFLAMAMLLSAAPAFRRVTAGFAISAPILALHKAFFSAFARASEATRSIESDRARAAFRGLAITLPVLVVFALLLAVADPTFALWRNTVRDLFTSWDFVPRTVFFVILLGLALGAYGYAAAAVPSVVKSPTEARKWLASSERLILLAGVSGLLWLFMLVQLSYLFGNLPSLAGSGVTFADYARRGFGELTIVALVSTFLIVASERYGIRDSRERILRVLTIALIVAVLFLLGSAFYRVILYEEAYGFTTARLYAQAFMVIIAAGLVGLTMEVRGELEPGRLFRRLAVFATAMLVVLIYWNHEAWIAKRNVDRFAVTGKLDIVYLTRELSPNAIPAIAARLPSLPEPMRSSLAGAILKRYEKRQHLLDGEWYEWNLGRSRARESLKTLRGFSNPF